MSHPETNPHFIRPLQLRDGTTQHSQPPPPGAAIKQPASQAESPNEPQYKPPLPHGLKPQGQRSKAKGPRGGAYEADKPFEAPQKDRIPTDPRDGSEYHTPWLISSKNPTPKEAHQVRDSRRDGEYHSPWMVLPPHQEPQNTRNKPEQQFHEPEGSLASPTQYHDDVEDHYPIHPRDSRPPPKLTRKKPQRQRSQVAQPKLHDHNPNREQDHYPLHPHDPKPSPREQPERPRRSQVPVSERTGALTWLIAAFCALFWIVVFLGGLIVLILYLVYRPRSPKFDLSSATLNAAYVDAGALLNADISILANFTNPNKKAGVEFSHMIIDLYYGNTLIATQYIESFSVARAHSMFANVHMVTSQVRLPLGEITRLQEETNRNAIMLTIKGVVRVRSNLGSFLRYSYRLYSHCTIMMSAPPGGVLRATRCRTKR